MYLRSSSVYPNANCLCRRVSASGGAVLVLAVERVPGGDLGEGDHVLAEPLPVRAGGGDLVLQLLVVDDPARLQVDEEHLAGLEPALEDDVPGGDVQGTDLGRHDHEVVLRDDVTAGSQAVAVEDGADHLAVGEPDRRGPVPGLDQAGVEGVEVLLRLGHRLVVLPRLRDQHHHRVRERVPALGQQLDGVIQASRVAEPLADDRQELLDVPVVVQVGLEQGLPGAHPVDVPAEGVDLPVVGDHPVRVGELPARERVRAEPGVEQAEGAGQAVVPEVVGEVLGDLLGGEHPLVDEGPARQAGEVEEPVAVRPGVLDLGLEALPDDVQLPLEPVLVGGPRPPADEGVEHPGLDPLGGVPDHRVVGLHGAPPEERLALLGDDPLEQLFAELTPHRVGVGEEGPDAVKPGSGEFDPERRAPGLEEVVGDLDEDPGAVPGVVLAPAGPPVVQVDQGGDPVADQPVRLPPLEVDDEPDPAGVVLVGRVVQPLGLGST